MNLYENIKNNNMIYSNKKHSKYMEEWTKICQAFCDKIGAELLFVNTDNFGYMTKDGQTVHMYADELAEYLNNENKNNQ